MSAAVVPAIPEEVREIAQTLEDAGFEAWCVGWALRDVWSDAIPRLAERKRDFYEPFEAFAPGRIVRTFPELLAAIRDGDFEQHKVEPFARQHLPAAPGSATDRIIDQLILPA